MNDLRVVLDTGVIVSAILLPRSIPRQSVDISIRLGRLLFSEDTVAEVAEVLRRPKFERYISAVRRQEILLAMIEQSEIIVVARGIDACRDPKDNKFLELSVEGNATHIVSGDADLLVLKSFEGVPIRSPAEFLTTLQPQ